MPRIVLAILSLLLGHAVSSARAQGLPRLYDAAWMGFDTGSFPAAFGPVAMAPGDLDGDGDIDVVVGQGYHAGPGVSLLRNLGNGTFAQPEPHPLPRNQSVGRVAVADIDGDGDLDVLATIPDTDGLTSQVGLWRNDGTGSLAAVERFDTGPGPVGLAVADFTGDGWPDLATADHGFIGTGTTVSLLVHNGLAGSAAGFLAPRAWTVGAGPLALAAGDVDGDGALDLAVGRTEAAGNTIDVLQNDRAGGFRVLASVVAGARVRPVIALADLDRDGDLDLVTSVLGSAGSLDFGVIQVRRNPGNGLFGPAEDHRLDDWSSPAADLAFADLDGDGLPEVLSANPTTRAFEGFRVLPSAGGGSFGAALAHPASQSTEAIALADVDGDSDLDVLTLARYSAAVTVHVNRGAGLFHRPPSASVSASGERIDAADIDGDGDIDLVTSAGDVSILRNDGTGRLAPAASFASALNPWDVKLRDLDGDGFPDLLLGPDAGFPPYHFATARNRGDGTFLPAAIWRVDSCGEGHIDAADLDHDGDLDVILTEEAACQGGGPLRIFVYRNDGSGAFQIATVLFAYALPLGIATGDLDRDGNLDLVTVEQGYGLGAFLGNGDLTFRPEVRSDPPVYAFTLADMNGDGVLDAGVTVPADAFGTDQVGVALGRGDGSFALPALVNGSSVLEVLRVAVDIDATDADCDGSTDLVVTNYASNDIGLFLGNGDGTLRPQVRYGAGITPVASVVADLSGDGQDDVASIVWEGPFCCGSAVAVLYGSCACSVPDVVPPDQGNVLRAVRRDADVLLSWTSSTAVRFRLHRDEVKTALGTTVLPPDTAMLSFVDAGGVGGPPRWFYRLKGLSPCTSTAGP